MQVTSDAVQIRLVAATDAAQLLELYQAVARQGGGIARVESEVTMPYIQYLLQTVLARGIGIVALFDDRIVAEVHCSRSELSVFRHMLTDLTIAVHPEFQNRGLGRQVFQYLLDHVSQHRPDILRVELITREGNQRAIALYKRLGFREEGRMEGRIMLPDGLDADVPMAWFNPNYNKS